MAAYTRLSSEDIEEILKLYGLEGVGCIEPLSLGISNSNYRCDLKNGVSVIVKVSNDKGIQEMREEQKILSSLEKFPYSLAPFKTEGGDTVYEWGQLYGAVFPFINGTKPMGERDEMVQLGKALGALHVFSNENKLEQMKIRKHSEVGYDLNGVLSYCKLDESLPEFKKACKELLDPEHVKMWTEANLPKGLIHGDLYIDNTLYANGKLLTLLDFEQAGIGAYLQDIGICASGSCLDRDGVSVEKIEAFLEGYQSERKLSDDETKLVNFSITLGFLDISLWRVKRFYEGDLDPSRRDSYKELLNLAHSFKNQM